MHIVRWVVGAALFVALLFLSLQNSDLVTLKFYQWWSWQAPLIFVVLIAFAVGVAAGLGAGVMRTTRYGSPVHSFTRSLRIAPIRHASANAFCIAPMLAMPRPAMS